MSQGPSLLVSPQQGFGNRLRALNSACIIAKITNRRLYHCWVGGEIVKGQIEMINRLNATSLEDYFLVSGVSSCLSRDFDVDEVYSEWQPGDRWFENQSSGQRLFNIIASSRNQNPCGQIIESQSNCILLETSLRVWPEKVPGISGITLSGATKNMVSDVYSEFIPSLKYRKLLSDLSPSDACVCVRTGDLGLYYQKANQSITDIVCWLRALKGKYRRITIFSNDPGLPDTLYGLSDIKPNLSMHTESIFSLSQHERAALEFLYLAKKTPVIFATPGSSFAQEASLFGRNRYEEILS